MKIHKLKTWPEYFELMVSGKKTFELRENDRDFDEGDKLILQEYDPNKKEYTGQELHVIITHMLGTNPFIELDNKVILSVRNEPLD